eukprot:CAMPEP_0114978836 /NCGR_PEP_ID=MMETSP0216-20121206/4034_1 /TAXON_ID=223996 /ORGANISM="Protocruzia adherens, Strain Boccale" /LENGTH=524 /DNA_ID=CAMNT_0002340089 /DNA_START=865 /DNA_END=2439 /DNA_ORIENTATION=+
MADSSQKSDKAKQEVYRKHSGANDPYQDSSQNDDTSQSPRKDDEPIKGVSSVVIQSQNNTDNAGVEVSLSELTPLERIQLEKIQTTIQRAKEFDSMGEYEKALAEYSKVQFLDKNNADVYIVKAELYLKMCDFGSAISHYKKANTLRPSSYLEERLSSLYFIKGLSMIDGGNCFEAIDFMDDIHLNEGKFNYLRALAFVGAGERERAFTELDGCLEKDANNVEARILKAKLLWTVDKTFEGNNEFWKVQSIAPNHPDVIEFLNIMTPKSEVYYEAAVKNIFQNNIKRAYENISEGLKLYHDSTKLLLLRASLLRKSENYEKALSDLEKASKFMHTQGLENQVKIQIALTYNDMGIQLFRREQYNDAITLFNEALNFLEKDPGVYINRGDCYREMGKHQPALADYHHALDLAGETAQLKARLCLVHNALGIELFNKQDYLGGQIEFSRALHYNDKMSDLYLNRGKSSFELQSLKEAYEDFKKAYELDPTNHEANQYLQNMKSMPSQSTKNSIVKALTRKIQKEAT